MIDQLGNTSSFFWKIIPFDDLPSDVRYDIANWILENHDYFKKENSAEYIHSNLYGLAKPPMVKIGIMPVALLSGRKAVSGDVVEKYAQMLRTSSTFQFNPIMIQNGQFLDGGHRLAAYKLANRTTIPVVEVGHITAASFQEWEDWMKNNQDFCFEPN